tara:strand:+ start:980 stop:1216 length:237 start_codon:yes stop_codon:yes gene_type:complete
MSECNGWSNRETWSAALTIGNDQQFYQDAKNIGNFKAFVEYQINGTKRTTTGEGYRWDDPKINKAEMESCIKDIVAIG